MSKVFTQAQLDSMSMDEILALTQPGSSQPAGAGAASPASQQPPAVGLSAAETKLLQEGFAKFDKNKKPAQPKVAGAGAGQPAASGLGARTFMPSNGRITEERLRQMVFSPMPGEIGKLSEEDEWKRALELSKQAGQDEVDGRTVVNYFSSTIAGQTELAVEISEIEAKDKKERDEESRRLKEFLAESTKWITGVEAALPEINKLIRDIETLVKDHPFLNWLNTQQMVDGLQALKEKVTREIDNRKLRIHNNRHQALKNALQLDSNDAPDIPKKLASSEQGRKLQRVNQNMKNAITTLHAAVAKYDVLLSQHNIIPCGAVGQARSTDSKRNTSAPSAPSAEEEKSIKELEEQFRLMYTYEMNKTQNKRQAELLRQNSMPLTLPSARTEPTAIFRQQSAPGAGAPQSGDPMQQYTPFVGEAGVKATGILLAENDQEKLFAHAEALKAYCQSLVLSEFVAESVANKDILAIAYRQNTNNSAWASAVATSAGTSAVAARAPVAAPESKRDAEVAAVDSAPASGISGIATRAPAVATESKRKADVTAVDAAPPAVVIPQVRPTLAISPAEAAREAQRAAARQRMLAAAIARDESARRAVTTKATNTENGASSSASAGSSSSSSASDGSSSTAGAGASSGAADVGAGAAGYNFKTKR